MGGGGLETMNGLFPYLVGIFDSHADVNKSQWVLQDLTSEFSCCYTVVPWVSTLVKLWLIVIVIKDVDLHSCCDAGTNPVDVFFRLSGLK